MYESIEIINRNKSIEDKTGHELERKKLSWKVMQKFKSMEEKRKVWLQKFCNCGFKKHLEVLKFAPISFPML